MTVMKSYWLRAGILLIVFVLGVFILVGATESDKEAIKTETKVVKKLINETWFFTGGVSDNPELASNYSLSDSGLPNCGAVNREVICQIQAPDDGNGKPDMNAPVDGTTVQQQIHEAQEALEDGNPTENTTVKGFRPE